MCQAVRSVAADAGCRLDQVRVWVDFASIPQENRSEQRLVRIALPALVLPIKATLRLRPPNVETLATSIYQYASRGSFEDGALAALLIVAASIGPVAWLTRFSDIPQGPA